MHGLLLSSDIREPISHALSTNREKLKFPLITLTLEDFLKNTEVFDEVVGGVPKIEWTLPGKKRITNSQEFFLINRVLSTPESLFKDFHPLDREYALAEFRAYLTFAIEAFPFTLAKPGPGGLSGNRFSLPQQWNIIKNSGLDILTPKFFLGNPKYSPFNEAELVIYSTPYNYYYWKPNIPSCKSKEINFCFSRPPGVPIICSTIGNSVFVFPYFDNDMIKKSIEFKITTLISELTEIFDFFIAECLLFVDNTKVTFGMISNIPYASKKKIFFERELINEFNFLLLSEAFCEL